MLFIVFSLLTQSVFADTRPVTCDATALGKSLTKLEAQSRELLQPTIQDWIQPVLDEAKTFSITNSLDEDADLENALTDLTIHFHASLQHDLNQLVKKNCITRVTSLVLKKILNNTSFTGASQVELSQAVRAIPNPAIYLFNLNEYEKMAESKLTPEKLSQWKLAQAKLDQSFGKRKSAIGKLTPSEHLFLNYSRSEINLFSNLFMEVLTLMNANSAELNVYSPVTKREVQLEFSPTDLANLSIRHFEREIGKFNLEKSFIAKPIDKADVVLATFYNQEVDAESVLVLLKNKSIREPRNTFIKRLGTISWGVAKAVLYQIPVTMPFITFGTLLYDAIEGSKKLKRSQADAAHLVPSPQ